MPSQKRGSTIYLVLTPEQAELHRRGLMKVEKELRNEIAKMRILAPAGVPELKKKLLLLTGGEGLQIEGCQEQLNYEMDRAGWIELEPHEPGYNMRRLNTAQLSLLEAISAEQADQDPAEKRKRPLVPYSVKLEGTGRSRRWTIYSYAGIQVHAAASAEAAARDLATLLEGFNSGPTYVVIGEEEDSLIVNPLTAEVQAKGLTRAFALGRADQLNKDEAPAVDQAKSGGAQ